jgi:hypothetical protein
MKQSFRSQVMWLVAAALVAGGGAVRAQDVQVITTTAVVDPTPDNMSLVTNGTSGGVTVFSSGTSSAGATSIGGAGGSGTFVVSGEQLGTCGGAGIVTAIGQRAKTEPRTWLGVGTDEVSEDVRAQLPIAEGVGLVVRHVEKDSPAAKAGIQENDILTKLDDQLLLNVDQLCQLVQMHKPGETVTVTGLRKGKETKFKASLVRKEGGDEESQFGVINFGGSGSDIKMAIPEEIRKLIEQHKGATTVFSTNISIHTTSKSSISSGMSTKTENGQTTITYNGQQVFTGPTTGQVSTRTMNENGQEYAAAFDGKKVLWENMSGAAEHLKP